MNTRFTMVKPPRGKNPRSNGIGLPYYSTNEYYNSLQLYDSSLREYKKYISFTVTINGTN